MKNRQDNCKTLYELLEVLGECDLPGMHIIDASDRPNWDGEGTFRVYHKDGYGFDARKRVDTADEETGAPLTYYYDVDTYFDGFRPIEAEDALTLIRNATK